MSLAENDPVSRLKILSSLYWRTGKAHVIGITGPPGCGKSSLIAQLAKTYRSKGDCVGIVAVDPSSQITGGALLGDRIRMSELSPDPKIFIRSMATRGYFGGVARATEDIVRIFDALHMDKIVIETTGAGQSDVDVKSLADTTVVVTAPGLGDEIQALKAGIMEIGDIFVVNKSDKENADRTMQEIYSIIMMPEATCWRPRVLKTNALSGEGVTPLIEAIHQHRKYHKEKTTTDELDRLSREVTYAAKRYVEDVALERTISTKWFTDLLIQVKKRKIDPYTAARKLLKKAISSQDSFEYT
jgi:LAO/AO transport system kinase